MSNQKDARDWFSAMSGKRVTAVDMAEILDISRNATNARLSKGLDSDDLIAISRALKLSPVHALVELGKLSYDEVLDFLEGDGTLLKSASPEQLIYQLAEGSLPASDRIALGASAKALVDKRDDLAARRNSNTPPMHVAPLDDNDIADAIREANEQPKAAHPATEELTEPDHP